MKEGGGIFGMVVLPTETEASPWASLTFLKLPL